MRDPGGILFDNLLAEYQRSSTNTVEGHTVVEWAKEWGQPLVRTRELIKHAIITGRMASTNVNRPCVTRPGYRSSCTLHRFVKKGKKR